MSRFATLLGLAILLAGCPKKNKGTSGAGAGSNAVSMHDGNPDSVTDGSAGGGGGGATDPVLPDDNGGGGSTEPDPGEITAGAGEGSSGGEAAPHVAPPNLDPDPAAAAESVNKHLKTARDALKGSKPDTDKAIEQAKLALAIDGTSVDAVVVLAHANYHKKLYDTAETILDMLFKDREASHDHPGVYYVYGLIYEKTGRPEAAEKAFNTAVKLKPNYGSALVNVGMFQLRNKQYDSAIETYEKLINDLNFEGASVYNSLGSAYRGRSADFDPGSNPQADWLSKAEAAYKKAIAADSNYGIAYYNLGLLYLDADPFPTPDGKLDTLVRLNKAKTYFDEYKNRPGVDMALYDERIKNVTKLIKREEKKRKKKDD
jgi:tetratricopeptide (TPR) repeat protein